MGMMECPYRCSSLQLADSGFSVHVTGIGGITVLYGLPDQQKQGKYHELAHMVLEYRSRHRIRFVEEQERRSSSSDGFAESLLLEELRANLWEDD